MSDDVKKVEKKKEKPKKESRGLLGKLMGDEKKDEPVEEPVVEEKEEKKAPASVGLVDPPPTTKMTDEPAPTGGIAPRDVFKNPAKQARYNAVVNQKKPGAQKYFK